MSLYDYRVGLLLMEGDPPFAALIQAAMRKADTDNQIKLAFAWPEIWQELQDRYNAPGGILPTDPAQHPVSRDQWAEENC